MCAEDDGGDGAEELQSAQSKRSALHKKAAAASLAVEDFARRFESGAVVVSELLSLFRLYFRSLLDFLIGI